MPDVSIPGPTARRLDHVGLNVVDINAMERWYVEAFGYRREFATRLDMFELDIVMLVHPERGDRFELLHRPGSVPGLRAATPPEAVLTEGLGHVAFAVDDLEGEYERLVALGARGVMSPRPSPEPGVRMAFIADPEGNLVELLDRTSATTGAVDGR